VRAFAGAGYFLRQSERGISEGGRAKPVLLRQWPEPMLKIIKDRCTSNSLLSTTVRVRGNTK
jgi:hypothetical protein